MLGIHQRAVQSEGGAVDGGSIIVITRQPVIERKPLHPVSTTPPFDESWPASGVAAATGNCPSAGTCQPLPERVDPEASFGRGPERYNLSSSISLREKSREVTLRALITTMIIIAINNTIDTNKRSSNNSEQAFLSGAPHLDDPCPCAMSPGSALPICLRNWPGRAEPWRPRSSTCSARVENATRSFFSPTSQHGLRNGPPRQRICRRPDGLARRRTDEAAQEYYACWQGCGKAPRPLGGDL